MKNYALLISLSLMMLMTQAVWGQYVVKLNGTDGSGITDTLTLAIDPAGTAGFDSLSPSLHEYEIPVAAKGLDFRFVSNFPADNLNLGSYTSIHHMAYPAQTDKWKLQFNVDSGRTNFTMQWPAGMASVGGGYWKITADPFDIIAFPDVDMTTTTTLSIPVSDIDSHTFYITGGDAQKYRSFTVSDITGAVDNKGKAGKSVARKAYASEGTFTWPNTLDPNTMPVNGMHIEWSEGIDGVSFSVSPPIQPVTWLDAPKNTKCNISFSGGPLAGTDVVTIYAIGNKGKFLQAKKWWFTNGGVMTPPKVKNPAMNPSSGSLLRYYMPNVNNCGEEAYSQTVTEFSGSNGLTIGDPVNPAAHDVKNKPIYRAVTHPKWKNVLTTLSDKTGTQSGPAACLMTYTDGSNKPILKTQKSLPPKKFNSALLGNAIALKVNIGLGDAGKIEEGGTAFGDLMYVHQTGDPSFPGGATALPVRAISASLDTTIQCLHSSLDPISIIDFNGWNTMIARINGAFSGPFDTLSFIAPIPPPHPKTTGTVAKGVHALAEVPFLYRTSFSVNLPTFNPPNIAALEAAHNPKEYKLAQNYPNPFNPTTTIEFSMPQDGIVTMKVYNILGQEVATLIDHEMMEQGQNDVSFDATQLASGVYYYRMIVNDGQFQQVKKMMLIK